MLYFFIKMILYIYKLCATYKYQVKIKSKSEILHIIDRLLARKCQLNVIDKNVRKLIKSKKEDEGEILLWKIRTVKQKM